MIYTHPGRSLRYVGSGVSSTHTSVYWLVKKLQITELQEKSEQCKFGNILMDFIIYLGIFGEGMCEYFQ